MATEVYDLETVLLGIFGLLDKFDDQKEVTVSTRIV